MAPRVSRMRAYVHGVLGAVWIFAAHALPAQGVRVTVVDAASGVPVAGAIVSLKREDGTRLTAALSDERGFIELRVARGTSVRAVAERIGYAEGASRVFAVAPEGTTVEIRLNPRTVELKAVDVRASATCSATGAGGTAAAALWDEVRKALTAASLTAGPGDAVVAWNYQRDLDPALRVLAESTSRASAQANGFATAPAWQLSRDGFVLDVDGATMYFAPDARLLVSDEFVRDHCFGVRVPDAGGPLVGLTFEPGPGRRVADVRGVLWVEASTGSPRELEYSYAGSYRRSGIEGAEGRMQFTALPNGQWVVERWSIRMPRSGIIRPQRLRFGDTGTRDTLLGYREEGGWLALREGELTTRGRVILEGLIYDSTRSQPLSNARVVLAGGAAIALTDSIGRYRLQTHLPGRFAVTVLHPRLAELRLEERVHFTTVSAGTSNRFDTGVPGSSGLKAHLCGAGSATAGTWAMVVRVVDEATHERLAGARVTVLQRKVTMLRSGASTFAASSDSTRETESDERGVAVFCGLTTREEVQVGAEFAGSKAQRFLNPTEAGTGSDIHEMTLSIENGAPHRATRRLRVVARVTDSLRALAGVEIRAPALSRSWYTGVDGSVDLSSLGDSTSALIVRSIGYAPQIVQWTGRGVEGVSGDVVLERSVTTLSEVSVNAAAFGSSRMRSFEERRARGTGFFMDREQLAKREGSPLSSVMATASGMRVERSRDGRVYLAATRSRALGGKACYPQIYLDGVRVWSPGDPGPRGDSQPPSIESFAVVGLEAIEVYDGPASTPIQYGGLGASCGTVLLWSRES